MSKDHAITGLEDAAKKTTLAVTSTAVLKIPCDSCKDENDTEQGPCNIPSATMYCTECEEHQCDECYRSHKKQRISRHHEVVPLGSNLEITPKSVAESLASRKQTALLTSSKSQDTDNSVMESILERHSESSQSILQTLIPLVEDAEYQKIKQIIKRPIVKEEDLEKFWQIELPYIIQRLKMWNGSVVSAQGLASLMTQFQKSTSNGEKRQKRMVRSKTQDEKIFTNPVSRLDLLTYIINASEFTVAKDILRVLSKFPVAIPLIVQDIKEKGRYIVSIPLIQDVLVEIESTSGQIAENHLFSSPFRTIVAVRLGDNTIGKSTILNQLMRKQFVFSSRCEAGSRYGKPRTLEGSVEIICMTPEVCNEMTWEILAKHYGEEKNETISILANLHGDVLRYEDALSFLLQFSSSFILFLMPNYSQAQRDRLKQLLRNQKIVEVLVDQDDKLDEDLYTVNTHSLPSEDTQETIRDILEESLGFERTNGLQVQSFRPESNLKKSLRYAESVDYEKVFMIVNFVKQRGCLEMKQILEGYVFESEEQLKVNEDLEILIKYFLEIVYSGSKRAKQYLEYLETHLSQLSDKESIHLRPEINEIKDRIRIIASLKQDSDRNVVDDGHNDGLKNAQEKLRLLLEKTESNSLREVHFARVIGKIYENSQMNDDFKTPFCINDAPSHFAELLINGHAIELLNGSSEKIQTIWIRAISDCVSRKLPNLRVFVLSIIGAQSTGKSTLLNALFSCRFPVSIGRCSRGLFMRMVYLDDNLRETCGCDAVILIDCEGLCSPEKMNDPKAGQKDRLLATYVMGISNLMLVNIRGEEMIQMTEILQIAIVAMARYREGGIAPDILMVQHLQTRNEAKMDEIKRQFCEAINKAFELINKKDTEIAASSNKCLIELQRRIEAGDLFHHFGPFKDGASVNAPPSLSYHEDVVKLYRTLLTRIESSQNKKTFERWSSHFESFLDCVKEENFALNFKNVNHITDFLYFEKKIAKVKELAECAIRKHREIFSTEIQEKINSCVSNTKTIHVETIKDEIMEIIQQKLLLILQMCSENCVFCTEFKHCYASLLQEMATTQWEEDTKYSLNVYSDRLRANAKKTLEQIFDASVVKQGCLAAYSSVITDELRKALHENPSGIYTEEQQNKIMENIWTLLQENARSKENRLAIEDINVRFLHALRNVYAVYGMLPDLLNYFEADFKCLNKLNETDDNMVNSTFFNKGNGATEVQFSGRLIDFVRSMIDNLIETIFQSRGGTDYLRTGLDFEEGMINQIRVEFPNIIKEIYTRFSVIPEDNLKQNLQIFTLRLFRKQMDHLQNIWNKHNRPLEILMERKGDYMTEIGARLKSGFSCAGEGELIANRLFKAMRKTAVEAAYDANVEAVKSLGWTTNSEKVRLFYFEQLANEVESGQKKRALKHFQKPKDSIEEWYKTKVNSIRSREELMTIYSSTVCKELSRVQRKITNSTCKKDIDEIVMEYITSAEDQYVSKLDPTDDDFEALRNSLDFHLKRSFEQENKEGVRFPVVSEDPEIKRRLGCTENCYFCGALCWGSRGHQVEKDINPEMECHHSCHQPSGLRATHNPQSKRLLSISCHNQKENARVYFKEIQSGSGVLWSEAKQKRFRDWKFDVHCVTMFDELMRWFFQELNEDIAAQQKLLAPERVELEENRCENLVLRDIVKVVRSKI